ncbi:prepilin-type N-terminal cleavage/methylation domain-containing protein [Bacillus suaedaesalsae]|uniref:Type II secretion system protein n=1 Tax=Bacillus suaedaesalsae TaxID=2810349 RepID=A0ABS2DFP6_9BACI|nr:type II secretion system protein [Bacillus suaedaesalsae]
MWKSNKGFSLLETLIASIIFFFVITALLPQIYLLTIERKNLEMQQFANQWLNEKLFRVSLTNEDKSDITLFNEIPFYFELEVDEEPPLNPLYRGCVKWTNLLVRERVVCGTVR